MLYTYVGLYGSGLFNFGSYVSLSILLLACFLGLDVPTFSFIFIENIFYYSCITYIVNNRERKNMQLLPKMIKLLM